MKMPGFTAEASIYKTSGSYSMAATVSLKEQVLPQQFRGLYPWWCRLVCTFWPIKHCYITCDHSPFDNMTNTTGMLQ